MKTSACHTNAAVIWISKHREVVAIGSGYALSEDTLWRQHSWCVTRDGILETTAPRVKYFGLLLQREEADAFASANIA